MYLSKTHKFVIEGHRTIVRTHRRPNSVMGRHVPRGLIPHFGSVQSELRQPGASAWLMGVSGSAEVFFCDEGISDEVPERRKDLVLSIGHLMI